MGQGSIIPVVPSFPRSVVPPFRRPIFFFLEKNLKNQKIPSKMDSPPFFFTGGMYPPKKKMRYFSLKKKHFFLLFPPHPVKKKKIKAPHPANGLAMSENLKVDKREGVRSGIWHPHSSSVPAGQSPRDGWHEPRGSSQHHRECLPLLKVIMKKNNTGRNEVDMVWNDVG